jgi:hypothetical protein
MPYSWPEDTDFALWELDVLESAETTSSRGKRSSSSCHSTSGTATPSWGGAAATATARSRPIVSTAARRFRPSTFLPPS